ncbi:hypothetical protein [Jiangella anatolica]|uniref:Uncharacterized protein n=1 Tax=Jiangella anatolica TaxID=2670374 RepID=A0A2W2B4Y7_9ACTN|nr:hypothetical protein [Jiangella anatolica]PZF80060.1 hypothetical protein C1I92_27935 [Jiangella anatolica]
MVIMATPTPARTPVPLNPYQWALGVLASAVLLTALIVLLVNQTREIDGLVIDEGSEAGRAIGVFLLGAGLVLGTGWMVVSALLWKPREPVRRVQESDHGTATLDR